MNITLASAVSIVKQGSSSSDLVLLKQQNKLRSLYRQRTSSVSSTDSTIPVQGSLPSSKKILEATQKNVTFDESLNQVISSCAATSIDDDDHRQWYTSQECDEMQVAFCQEIDRVRRSQSELDISFRDAIHGLFQMAQSSNEELLQQEVETNNSKTRSLLRRSPLCAYAPGMELRVCRSVHSQRSSWRRKQLGYLMMYNLQTRRKQETRTSAASEGGADGDLASRELANKCANASRPARMFAQMTAHFYASGESV